MEQDRLTQKCSTIFIAVGDQMQVFHSLDQVPPELRKKLAESTRSLNSATILIADQKGREEILRALDSPRSDFDRRLAASLMAHRASAKSRLRRLSIRWPNVVRLLAAGALGYLVWTFLSAWW
jgi:hypothetical protein